MSKKNGRCYSGLNQRSKYNLVYSAGYPRKSNMGIDRRFRFGKGRWKMHYGGIYTEPVYRQYNPSRYYRQYNPSKYVSYRNNPELIVQATLEKKKKINLKIEELKIKIKEEIESRRVFIRKYILKDEDCFVVKNEYFLQLKKDFVNYLFENSEYHFLGKKKFKKKLKNIRFNLNEGIEDVLICRDGRILGTDQPKSVLESKSSEWKKWEDTIRLIGRNLNKFKLSLKKKELNKLYSNYDQMTFLKQEEKVIICEKCGSENLKKANYCHYCGDKF